VIDTATHTVSGAGSRDEGLATVWAAAGVAVLSGALLIALHLGTAIAARHQAEAAADLSALAAAGVAVEGTAAACARAADIASAMGGRVVFCALAGWDALVSVEVPVSIGLPGRDRASGRARAGPVPDPLPVRAPPPVTRGMSRSGSVDRRQRRVTGDPGRRTETHSGAATPNPAFRVIQTG